MYQLASSSSGWMTQLAIVKHSVTFYNKNRSLTKEVKLQVQASGTKIDPHKLNGTKVFIYTRAI